MKKIAISQSNYIPWKGYFDLISYVDEFILYDDMQYTRRDWRNRNKIKTSQGTQWLSVPVKVKGKYHQKINQTEIDGDKWASMHWKSIKANYQRTPYFAEIAEWLMPLYLETPHHYLSDLNRKFIDAICMYLSIQTKISNSCDYRLCDGKTERLASLCAQADGTEYVSGPAAKSYLDENIFTHSNVKVTWYDYSNYPEYPQLWQPFVHELSILDMLFNCGPSSYKFLKHVRP